MTDCIRNAQAEEFRPLRMRTLTLRNRYFACLAHRGELISDLDREIGSCYLWIAQTYRSLIDQCLWELGYSKGYNDFWRERDYCEDPLCSRSAKDGYYFGFDRAFTEARTFNPRVSELPLVPLAVLKISPHFNWEAYQRCWPC